MGRQLGFVIVLLKSDTELLILLQLSLYVEMEVGVTQPPSCATAIVMVGLDCCCDGCGLSIHTNVTIA